MSTAIAHTGAGVQRAWLRNHVFWVTRAEMTSMLLRAASFCTLWLAAGAAHADCSLSSDSGAAARRLNPTIQADADLIVAMALVPKLMHVDYEVAAKKPVCGLGALTHADSGYELWGDDAHGRERKAIPAKKGATIALILPVVDQMKSFSAPHEPGKPAQAQVAGYFMATLTKTGELTAWAYYSGMPDAETLKHDMNEALSGNSQPIFRNGRDGKTSLFLSK